MLHFGARYYDPQVGRFLSRDAVLSEHPYLYCEHEPVNLVDPSGYAAVGVFFSAIAVPGLREVAVGVAIIVGVTVGLVWIYDKVSDFIRDISQEDIDWRTGKPKGEGWEWRGKPPEGGREGSWYNPGTGESVHPDLDHGPPYGPHVDYRPGPGKPKVRIPKPSNE